MEIGSIMTPMYICVSISCNGRFSLRTKNSIRIYKLDGKLPAISANKIHKDKNYKLIHEHNLEELRDIVSANSKNNGKITFGFEVPDDVSVYEYVFTFGTLSGDNSVFRERKFSGKQFKVIIYKTSDRPDNFLTPNKESNNIIVIPANKATKTTRLTSRRGKRRKTKFALPPQPSPQFVEPNEEKTKKSFEEKIEMEMANKTQQKKNKKIDKKPEKTGMTTIDELF